MHVYSSTRIIASLNDAPNILASPKTVSLTVNKGTKIRLWCEADGNPKPQFVWHKNSDIISSGFISSGNSSILTLHHAGEEEFARFVCTAKNRIGWDALTFNVHREKEPPAKQYTEPHTEAGTVPRLLAAASKPSNTDNEKSQVLLYASVSGAVVLIAFFVLLMTLIYRRRSNNGRKKGRKHDAGMLADSELLMDLQTNAFYPTGQPLCVYGGKDDSPDRANTHPITQRVINPMFSGALEWEIPQENLNIEKVIGRGAFGVVSRALAWDIAGKSGWTVVAVKSVQDRPLVVVEYAQYGDLLGYLRRSRGVQDNYYSDPSVKPGSTLTSRQLLKFAWEISDGMHYVSMKKIIHRDLAARNVLVGEDEVCKITDFGMARDVQEDDIYVRTHEGRLPIKWTAPEALFGSGAYTTSSDVWSYGVVLYEIFTVGGDPFPGVLMRDIPALLENGYRMSRPKYINSQLYETMTECWENDPSKRPDFGSLKATFHKLMEEEEQEYVNLEELFYENVLPSSC
ncbi:proto-oncogene tyrosine-protein kinase receptor Ret-like isoform X3 [Montipora foliosa]|uniref:proto-oncogene tyrosine-protein kinase receptor Ret-like isoform X3 n=1 Tax=Montipora foliosa TaxID=591990 RepID=UPI0035F173FE